MVGRFPRLSQVVHRLKGRRRVAHLQVHLGFVGGGPGADRRQGQDSQDGSIKHPISRRTHSCRSFTGAFGSVWTPVRERLVETIRRRPRTQPSSESARASPPRPQAPVREARWLARGGRGRRGRLFPFGASASFPSPALVIFRVAKARILRCKRRRTRAAGRSGTFAWSSPWVGGVIGCGVSRSVDGLAAGRRSHAEHAQGTQQGREKSVHDAPRRIGRRRPVGSAPSPSPFPVLGDGVPLLHEPRRTVGRGGAAPLPSP